MEYASSDTAIPGDLRMALIAATSAAFFLFTVSLYVIGHAGFTLFFPNEAIKNIWIRYFLSMNLGLSVVITIMVALGAVNFFSFLFLPLPYYPSFLRLVVCPPTLKQTETNKT